MPLVLSIPPINSVTCVKNLEFLDRPYYKMICDSLNKSLKKLYRAVKIKKRLPIEN